MRAGFVLTTVAAALTLGITAGVSDSRLLTAALISGFIPAMIVVSSAVERLAGRDMYDFTAPYPYRWMRERRGSPWPRDRTD